MVKNKNLKFIYNVVGFAVIVFLAIREICGAVLARLPFEADSAVMLIIGIAVFLAACLVPTITIENTLGLHPKLFRKSNATDTLAAVAYGYVLILCTSIANSVVLIVLRSLGLEFAPRALNIPDGAFAALLYFVYVCILPPLLEEIFTRGYILNAFRCFGTTFAVIASSLVFGLLHSSLENMIMFVGCGVILAQLYLAFDSIWPAMLLHCVNNSVSFLMTGFQQRANAQSALVLTVFVYVCAIIFGIWGKKHLDSRGIRLSACFEKDHALFKTRFFCRRAYMAVAAVCILIFLAAFVSFNSLI